MNFPSRKQVIEDQAEFGFPAHIVAAGKKLLEQAAVTQYSIIIPKKFFEVLVFDVFTHRVEVEINGGGPQAKCPCSYFGICAHRYAAVKYLYQNGVLTKMVTPSEVPLVSTWYSKLKPKTDSLLLKKLQRLDEMHRKVLREGLIQEAELTQFSGSFSSFRQIRLHDYGPIETPEQFCHTFHAYLASRGFNVPDFITAVTNKEKVKELVESLENLASTQAWRQRFMSLPAAPSTEPQPLNFRIVVEQSQFTLWQVLNDGEFRKPRLQDLQSGIENGKYVLSPEAQIIWDLFVQLRHSYGFPAFRWDYPAEHATTFNRLLRRPELEQHIFLSNGSVLKRSEDELKLIAEPGEKFYQLKLSQPNGKPLHGQYRVFPGRPYLFLAGDTVYKGPMLPKFLADNPDWRVPRSVVESSDGIQALQTLGIPIPAELEKRLVRVAGQLSLYGQMVKVGENEFFSLKIKYSSADGRVEEAYTGSGEWRSYNPSVSNNQDTITVYDSSEKKWVTEVLSNIDLKWDDHAGAWRKKIGRNFPDRFLEWSCSLPKQIELHLDPFLQSLRSGPVRATVQLNCKETSIDWFDLNVDLKVSDTSLTREEIRMLLNAKGGFVRMGDRGYMRLQIDLSEEDQDAMAKLGLSPTDFSAEPQRLHALQLGDKSAKRFLPEQHAARIERRIEEIKTRVSPAVPEAIQATLRPYQIEGFHFLAYLAENNFGGILADDMGLGKTIQTLAWLAWLKFRPEKNGQTVSKPSLVVCPKSVMDNWRAETAKFLPSLKAQVCQGIREGDLKQLYGENDLLVLNYAQLRNFEEELTKLEFEAIILDEGQYIKNPASQTAYAARNLRGAHRLVLSGTPIENRLLDLWSLMSFAMPGALGTQAYFTKLFNEKTDNLARKRLAARVRPFLLRRTKNQVAQDLPDRIEEDLFCEMETKQKKLYKAELKRARMMLLGIKTAKQLQEQRFNFLSSLLRLRQICCHPLLIDKEFPRDESAKLGAFLDLIEPLIDEGQKVLVFSQFVSMLDILRKEFEERGWDYYYLSGETEDRGELVEKFQKHEGAATFLISLKAGGFGLNLTAASYVVLFDPWWNPAVENQAIDRTHRIGQKNKVIAYRLLIKGSIEEKIRLLQKQKSSLAEGVLGDESFGSALSLQDFQYLFSDETE